MEGVSGEARASVAVFIGMAFTPESFKLGLASYSEQNLFDSIAA